VCSQYKNIEKNEAYNIAKIKFRKYMYPDSINSIPGRSREGIFIFAAAPRPAVGPT
jgi:hypothetical protein